MFFLDKCDRACQSILILDELRVELDTTKEKTQSLVEGAGEVSTKVEELTTNFDRLKEFFETIGWAEWSEL